MMRQMPLPLPARALLRQLRQGRSLTAPCTRRRAEELTTGRAGCAAGAAGVCASTGACDAAGAAGVGASWGTRGAYAGARHEEETRRGSLEGSAGWGARGGDERGWRRGGRMVEESTGGTGAGESWISSEEELRGTGERASLEQEKLVSEISAECARERETYNSNSGRGAWLAALAARALAIAALWAAEARGMV